MEKETKKKFWDCEEAVTRTTPLFMAVSEGLSVLVFLGGCLVLLGWVLDIPSLKSVFPGLVTMKANTAVCFVLSGFSLWALQLKRRDIRRFQIMAAVGALGIFGIGFATLLEYATRRDLGIDQFLFKELSGAIFTSSPNRMAFNTAVNFTITGLALLLWASKRKSRCFFVQILILPVGIISLLAFVGYLYKAPPLILGLDFSTAMPLHAMLMFLALFFGILYCRPGCGIMTLVSSEALGGKLVRRIFPVAVLLPILLGWVKLHGERAGLITNELGVSFAAIGNLTCMAIYIYALSFWVNQVDSERLKNEVMVQESEEKFRGLFENSRDAFMILDPSTGKFISGNPATIEMFQVKDEAAFMSLGPWDLSPEQQPDGSVSVVKAKEMIETALRKGFHFFDWTHKRVHGEEFLATVLLTRITLRQKTIIHAIIRDITERKAAEIALKQKIEELERFNKLAVGRELKMIELKEKIKALEEGKK